MFPSKLIFLTVATFISISLHHVDAEEKHYKRLRSVSQTRSLSKGKGSKKKEDRLRAQIEAIGKDYKDIDGKISIREHKDLDDRLVLAYDFTDGPEDCEDCMLSIFDGDACDDLGDSYDDDGRYDSDYYGEASGAFKLDSAYELEDLECKFIVIYDGEDDDDDDDDKKKSKKKDDDEDDDDFDDDYDDDDDFDDDDGSKKRKLVHVPRSPNRHRYLSKKGKGSKIKKVGCGQLIPRGESSSYCDNDDDDE